MLSAEQATMSARILPLMASRAKYQMQSSARGQTATVTATRRVRVHGHSSHRLCVNRARSRLAWSEANVPILRGVRLHGSALFSQDSVLLHRLGVIVGV